MLLLLSVEPVSVAGSKK